MIKLEIGDIVLDTASPQNREIQNDLKWDAYVILNTGSKFYSALTFALIWDGLLGTAISGKYLEDRKSIIIQQEQLFQSDIPTKYRANIPFQDFSLLLITRFKALNLGKSDSINRESLIFNDDLDYASLYPTKTLAEHLIRIGNDYQIITADPKNSNNTPFERIKFQDGVYIFEIRELDKIKNANWYFAMNQERFGNTGIFRGSNYTACVLPFLDSSGIWYGGIAVRLQSINGNKFSSEQEAKIGLINYWIDIKKDETPPVTIADLVRHVQIKK